ncbi:MAG: hypothetical protein OD814_001863, partial [Candidatus Alkanophagales archaeon MCA70_species_1]|nr:hypothetical protein [Candidatus Alkanophaga volatiphilum]
AVVENVSVNSTPVVVANMVSVGFFTKTYIPMLLENLTYKYNGSKALCPHENMVKWVEISANKEISTFVLQIYDYDGETLLNITIKEVGEYHGEICPCVAAAFRATQLALSKFEKPVRGDIEVICAHPSKGHRQTFEYIFGGENLRIELPAGTDIVNLSVENYAYTFIQKSSGHEVHVEAREDIFPERFFDLRKKCKTGTATPEEKKAFKYAKEDLKSAFLYLPEARVFVYNVTIAAPSVEIWTDKQTYHPFDTMSVGLGVTNPGVEPFGCRFAIWLEMQPYGVNFPIVYRHVTLPANLNYSNPAFLRFKLPYILPGTYVWHAAIIDPTTGELVSHDAAEWQFGW